MADSYHFEMQETYKSCSFLHMGTNTIKLNWKYVLNFSTIKGFLKPLRAKPYFKMAARRHLELQEPAKNTSLVPKILFILDLSPFQRHIIQHAITKTATGNLLLPDYLQ